MNHRPEEVRKVAKAICQVVTGGDCVMQERGRAPCTDQICRIMPIARDALARAALAKEG